MKLFDKNRFNRVKADCENFCDHFNAFVSNAVSRGDLIDRPTPEMLRGLAVYDATALKEGIKKTYEAESKKMPRTLRLSQERERDELLKKADKLAFDIDQFVQSKGLSVHIRMGAYERLRFLTFDEGKAETNEELIRQECTTDITDNPFIMRLTEKAKAIHRELCALDWQLRKATNGNLGFIGSPEGYADHVIEIYDGVIDLSLERLPKWAELPESSLDVAPSLDSKADQERYIVRDYEGRAKPLSEELREERKEVEK